MHYMQLDNWFQTHCGLSRKQLSQLSRLDEKLLNNAKVGWDDTSPSSVAVCFMIFERVLNEVKKVLGVKRKRPLYETLHFTEGKERCRRGCGHYTEWDRNASRAIESIPASYQDRATSKH